MRWMELLLAVPVTCKSLRFFNLLIMASLQLFSVDSLTPLVRMTSSPLHFHTQLKDPEVWNEEETCNTKNPLLEDRAIPRYGSLKPADFLCAVRLRVNDGEAMLNALEATLPLVRPTFENVMVPLQSLSEHTYRPWGILSTIQRLNDTAELRRVHDELNPMVEKFSDRMLQSRIIYDALWSLQHSDAFYGLPEAHQRVIALELRDRTLGGCGLEPKAKTRFQEILRELGDLSNNFTRNKMDAMNTWRTTLYEGRQVRGIPRKLLARASKDAIRVGHQNVTVDEGPWLFKINEETFGSVMTYAEDSKVREAFYKTYITLASAGKEDNTFLIKEMLKLREEQAALLNMSSYVNYSFASKVATVDQVYELTHEVQKVARPAAKYENTDLLRFASDVYGLDKLRPWDVSFLAEKQFQSTFGINQEELREYFPFPAALNGALKTAERVFGVAFQEEKTLPGDTAWHDDVIIYRAVRDGRKIGHLLFDPYERPGQKATGGWMDTISSRRFLATDPELQEPVALVVTNFQRPQVELRNFTIPIVNVTMEGSFEKPSLLLHTDVSRLFHEIGHALHVLLTKQVQPSISGINGIEWDTVEVSSMFMENWWIYDDETRKRVIRHYRTGEFLPSKVRENIRRSQHFRTGSQVVYQNYLATVDLKLHEDKRGSEHLWAIDKEVAADTLVMPRLGSDRSLCIFSHIFSGGYAAGYYSYRFGEVITAQIFKPFLNASMEEDEDRIRSLGRFFEQKLLAYGGGRDMKLVFNDVLGGAPNPKAFIELSGLLEVGMDERGHSERAVGTPRYPQLVKGGSQ